MQRLFFKKYVVIVCVSFLYSTNLNAQKIFFAGNEVKGDSIYLKELAYKTTYTITINAENLQADYLLKTTDNTNSTAKANSDYVLTNLADTIILKEDNPKQEFTITILPDAIVEKETEFFEIVFTNKKNEKVKTLTVFITDEKNEEANQPKPLDNKNYNKLLFLNAFSFDFSKSEEVRGSYVGNLSIQAPQIFVGKKNKVNLGFIAGIMKINYIKGEEKNTVGQYNKDYVFIKPFDTLGVGAKILRQNNKYTSKVSNTNWSIYFQPTIRLTPLISDNEFKQNFQLYAHIHLELLVSKWIIENGFETKFEDTLTVNNAFIASNNVVRYINEPSYTLKYNNAAGYFGVGLTLFATPWKNGIFNLQATIGKTTDNYILQTIDPNKSNQQYLLPGYGKQLGNTQKEYNGFYLFRSQYTHNISDNAQLTIGADVRGFLPRYQPKYALYAGLQVNMDKVAEIFK